MGSFTIPKERQTWAITASGVTVMGKTKAYNTYEEMLHSSNPGLINYVTDASGDPTVNKGFAVYRYSNGIFSKIYEGEMMDQDPVIISDWNKLVNGPSASPAEIDAAVLQSKQLTLQKSDEGQIIGLATGGVLLATQDQLTVLEGKVSGALHFKGVVEDKDTLPTEGNEQGDVYVDQEGKEYVYVDGVGFEEFGTITDLTSYYTKDEVQQVLTGYLSLTDGKFSGLIYMEEAATTDAAQNVLVSGSNAIMNRISIGQQDPTGFDANTLYSFKYFESGPKGMKGFVDYLKAKGVDPAITSAIRLNGVQIQDTGKKISDIPFYQSFQNANDPAPRKTIQLANHDTISGIKTDGTGVNIAMVSKWDKVDLGSAQIQMNLNSNADITINDQDVILTDANFANHFTIPSTAGFATETFVTEGLASKVDKEEGKGLSTLDFTEAAKGKLDGIEAGAQVNVQADWSATEGAAFIKHKPEIPSIAGLASETFVVDGLSGKVDKEDGKLLSSNDFTDAQKAKLASLENYDDALVLAKIGQERTDREAALQNYYTIAQIDAKIASVLRYQGVVDTRDDLDTIADPVVGDVWHVVDDAGEYAWNGTAWEPLGSSVDLTAYATTVSVNDAVAIAREELAIELEAESQTRENADLSLQTKIEEEATARQTQDASLKSEIDQIKTKYVVQDIISSIGTAKVWNETSGGGAMYTKADGSKSFVGVHDGTGTGTGFGAQIYAFNTDKSRAVRFNVFPQGITYAKNTPSAEMDITLHPELELAVKQDITVALADYFTKEEVVSAIEDSALNVGTDHANALLIANADGSVKASTFKVGGTVISDTPTSDVVATEKAVADLVAQKETSLQDTLAKKVTATLTSDTGTALIFNEADGGGTMFTKKDGSKSFVGVHDGTGVGTEFAAQIYAFDADKANTVRFNVFPKGITYAHNTASADMGIEAHPEYELAVKKDIQDAISVAQTELDTKLKDYTLSRLTTNTGKSLVWNENSGGGAKWEGNNKINSFVGVNDGTDSGIYGMVYVVNTDKTVNPEVKGVRFTFFQNGITYVANGPRTDCDINAHPENELAVKGDVAAVQRDCDTLDGNIISVTDRLVALEAQIVALKQTDVAAVTDAADLSQADKDLIITIAEPISGTTTVSGKSIEVKQLTTNNATTIFKTTGDVTMKNLTTTGDLPKSTANAQIRIVSGDYVRITDSVIDQTGYNAIEIGLGSGSGPMPTKSITIDNVTFNSTLSNNAILIFATEDGSVITISNCTFKKCSNPVRLSNAKGGKVTLNLVNCEFTEWESNDMWAGIVIMQDYTSGSVDKVRENNLFGPDKVTINLINCTHAGEKITMPEDIATVCGTKDAATQLFYVWSNEDGLVTYDADRYPVINIQ